DQRDSGGKTAFDRHGVEFRRSRGERGTPRMEKDTLAIGRPANRAKIIRMKREAARFAAIRCNDVDAATAVVVAGESDSRTIGRKDRLRFVPTGSEAAQIAAVAIGGPDTAGISKSD